MYPECFECQNEKVWSLLTAAWATMRCDWIVYSAVTLLFAAAGADPFTVNYELSFLTTPAAERHYTTRLDAALLAAPEEPLTIVTLRRRLAFVLAQSGRLEARTITLSCAS